MRASLAVAFVLLAACAFAQSQTPKVPREQQQPGAATANAQPPINITVNVPEPDPQIAKDEGADRKANLEIQNTIGNATIWIAIIALVQGVASIGAFLMARRAADATRDSVNEMIAANRPWLGLGGTTHFHAKFPQPEGFPSYFLPHRIGFTLTNGGRSPAILTGGKVTARLYSVFPDTPKYAESRKGLGASRGLIVPGWLGHDELPMTYTDEEANDLRDEKTFLFIFGEFHYEDIRTGTKHWTRVCGRYDVKTGTVKYHTSYNDAT